MVRALLVLLWVAAPTTLLAQTLTGVVRDASGTVVPGAAVAAIHTATRDRRSTIAGEGGTYTLASLRPGLHTINVTLPGFQPMAREVRVYAGEVVRLDVELAPAGVSEIVTVVQRAPLRRADTAALGHVLDGADVEALPLNGRLFITLAARAPGVALPPGSVLPRINGGRPRTNEYLFDGISVLQPEPGQVAFYPLPEAIESVTIETNSPPAEFGRFNGGVVNLTTRSGTAAPAGALFGFLRHEALNARNPFSPVESSRPLFRRGLIGGVVSGPVARDRVFFFADYQRQRQTVARTVISTVPTTRQRQGLFTEAIGGQVPAIYDPATREPFTDNVIPPDRFDPAAAALLGRYPLPTSDGTANNFSRTAHESDDQDQVDVRLDNRPADGRDWLFARLSTLTARTVPVAPLPDGSGVPAGTPGPQRTHVRSVALGYRRTAWTKLYNDVRAGDTTRSVRRRAARTTDALLPTYVVAGYQQLGSPPGTKLDLSTGVRQVADTLTVALTRHTIKTGFDLRWSRLDVTQPPSPAGLYQFSTLFTDRPGAANTGAAFASFLLGQVQSFSLDVQAAQIRNRAHTQEYFVQDDWRASDRLTVNLGVRYTLNFPSHELSDQAAVFNLQTQELEYLGRDGHARTARRLHKNNFGPRFGIVRKVADRALVRLGYGLVWIEQSGVSTPFTTPSFPFLQTVSQRALDNLTPAFALATGPSATPVEPSPRAGLGQGVFAVDRHLGSGYAQQWNLSFQRDIFRGVSIELGYAGSKITHVGIPDTNLNQLSADALALGPALLERVPNPYVGMIPASSTLGAPTITVAQLLKPYPRYTTVALYRNNVGNTSYHGFRVGLEQRSAHGLACSLAYTRSTLIDDASSVFDASILTGPVANSPVADSFDRRHERDVSTGDIPHVLVATAIWALPRTGGLTLSAIATLQSGTPLAVTQLTNFNAFGGFGIQRPNRHGNPSLAAAGRSAAHWFDTSVFSVAPQFTLGNSSRNPVRGPAYRHVDLAITRRTRLRGALSVEGRADIFNLLNTPALGAPNTVLGSAGFGSITSAGDPRVVQLGLKLLF